jgi:integrase
VGTILTRTQKNGSTRYTAIIRRKVRGQVVHTESETFGRKALANEWMRRREAELDISRARGKPIGKDYTLGELITWYRKEIKATAEWGRTKEADLKRLENHAISKKRVHGLRVADYIEHAMERRDEGAGPATVGNDLVWIGQVLKSARGSLDIDADLQLLNDARHELRTRKLLQKSRYRDRRLTAGEETALLNHFGRSRYRSIIPMADVMAFALATARRQDEIFRLRRPDLDREKGIAWLDDVKHPRLKRGNRRSFRLLPEAWAIIDRQPEHADDDRVFPFNHRSAGSEFTRACKLLALENLHFHDLRHEATSRLFERGYSIQEVAQFTLHESWTTLKRYTHLKPEDVKERPPLPSNAASKD